MALFDEIPEYRAMIMKQLCGDKDIVKLITNKKNPTVPNRDLLYNNIYPYKYKPNATIKADTFVTFVMSVPRVYNKTEKQLKLVFYVFTDESLMRTKSGLRIDLLAKAVDRLFNGNNSIALGKMELEAVEDLDIIGSTYHGYTMIYKINDFNRPTMNRGW